MLGLRRRDARVPWGPDRRIEGANRRPLDKLTVQDQTCVRIRECAFGVGSTRHHRRLRERADQKTPATPQAGQKRQNKALGRRDAFDLASGLRVAHQVRRQRAQRPRTRRFAADDARRRKRFGHDILLQNKEPVRRQLAKRPCTRRFVADGARRGGSRTFNLA